VGAGHRPRRHPAAAAVPRRPAALAALGGLLHVGSLAAALVCMVLRFWSSRGTERQQLRWVALGAVASVVGPLAAIALAVVGVLPTLDAFSWPLLLSVPLAIAVAVLRYRLWDLDRLISCTVTYALVTAVLVVPYLLVVGGAGRLAAGAGSLAVAAATRAAAVLFAPLRRRVQRAVDRRFNRRRYDAAQTIADFSLRLRDQLDLDTSRPSCWRWSTGPCSRPGPRSGCGPGRGDASAPRLPIGLGAIAAARTSRARRCRSG
jgi:hypothetical protein